MCVHRFQRLLRISSASYALPSSRASTHSEPRRLRRRLLLLRLRLRLLLLLLLLLALVLGLVLLPD
jgi:hypothetical protein